MEKSLMLVTRVFATTLTAGVALGLSAPIAAADSGPSNIQVIPQTVRQGGTLAVTVDGTDCRGSGQTFDAVVESDAFPRTPLQGLPNEGSSVARPTIFAQAKPGTYTVTATCGGRTITGGTFTVVPGRGARGGLGGSSQGPNYTELLVGSAAVVAAVGAGVYQMRRRSADGPA
jgi:hypothetical protein